MSAASPLQSKVRAHRERKNGFCLVVYWSVPRNFDTWRGAVMSIESVALWIGYAVMTFGGVGIALAVLWLIAEIGWKWWVNGLNTLDLMEATAEWRKNHPEKFARWKRTNGKERYEQV